MPIATFVLSAIIIFLTLHEGQRRGMDYIFSASPEGELSSIAVALSDMVYGLNVGYVGYASVREKLVSAWPKGSEQPRNQIQLENEKNKGLQNLAIQSAASMPQPKPGYVGDRTLLTVGLNEDIGYVDFVKLSFRVFGMNMQAMHYMFFLLLSVSAAAFLLTFRSDAVAQAVLVSTLFAFYVELYTSYFTITSTFSGMRHGSTLSLIPMWHFFFLMLRRDRIGPESAGSSRLMLSQRQWETIATVACALIQLMIFALALRMRGSAVWGVLFIVSFALVRAIVPFWRRRLGEWPWPSILRRIVCWPVVVLLAGLFINNLSMNAALHPVYFTDDTLPYHGLWHTAILGMQYSPHLLPEKSAALVRSGALDAAGYYAAEGYLDKTRFLQPSPDPNAIIATYASPWTGTVKWRLHDNITRRVFFEIAAQHPVDMLVLYAYKKPLAILSVTLDSIFADGIVSAALIVLGGALVTCILLFQRSVEAAGLGSIVLLAVAPLPFAALPNVWAYAILWTMSDFILILLMSLQMLVGVAGVLVVRQIGRWRRDRMSEPAAR